MNELVFICIYKFEYMPRPETTRQILIEKAAVMFNKRGGGTAVDDILKAAKVEKASLYGHFPGKTELSYATVDYMLGKIVEKRNAAIAEGKTAKDILLRASAEAAPANCSPSHQSCP